MEYHQLRESKIMVNFRHITHLSLSHVALPVFPEISPFACEPHPAVLQQHNSFDLSLIVKYSPISYFIVFMEKSPKQ